MQTQPVGVVGVGFAGSRFVGALVDAGRPVTAFDVDERALERATDRGAIAADSPREVGAAADTVVVAVPGEPEVDAVLDGPNGLAGALGEESLVVDMTTTGPAASERHERRCRERGAAYLAAPFTRAAPRDGLFVLAGGTEAAYEDAGGVLDAVADDHRRVGGVADARTLKLLLQLRYAARAAVDAEVVALGRESDVDPGILNDFLGMGLSERLLSESFEQDHEGLTSVDIWEKDLGYLLDHAAEIDAPAPLTAVVHEAYEAGRRGAADDEGDPGAILRRWRPSAGRE